MMDVGGPVGGQRGQEAGGWVTGPWLCWGEVMKEWCRAVVDRSKGKDGGEPRSTGAKTCSFSLVNNFVMERKMEGK